MYGRIIVPIDGSDLSLQALAVATSLAEHSDATLVLVTVITSRGPSLDAETLTRIAATVDAPMIETRLLHDDDPGERLAAFIRSEPDALVCLSTHGRGRIRQTVLGSVAARIVRDGGRPVVMVGPNYGVGRHRRRTRRAKDRQTRDRAQGLAHRDGDARRDRIGSCRGRQRGNRGRLFEPGARAPRPSADAGAMRAIHPVQQRSV